MEYLVIGQALACEKNEQTFENTLVAMEKIGQLLQRAMAAFSAVAGANPNPVLQRVRTEEAPKLAAHADAIYLDAKLFARCEQACTHLPTQVGYRPRVTSPARMIQSFFKCAIRRHAVLHTPRIKKLEDLPYFGMQHGEICPWSSITQLLNRTGLTRRHWEPWPTGPAGPKGQERK